MKYAGIIENDITDGINGISVSLWTQGCPHRCKGCHNPQTWDFDGGIEVPENFNDIIIDRLRANGVKRNLSILGGEPLCPENAEFVESVIKSVKSVYPEIKIIIWTGYVIEELLLRKDLEYILSCVDYVIDGPFDLANRNITLRLRGSPNQRIFQKVTGKFREVTNMLDSVEGNLLEGID